MSQVAILKFGQGSFASGFPVTFRLGREGEPATLELDGTLPAIPQLQDLAQTWRFNYRSRSSIGVLRKPPTRGVRALFRNPSRRDRALKAPSVQVTRQRSSLVSISQDWVQALNHWLNQGNPTFQPIRDQLLKAIVLNPEVRLIIQAQQLDIWQLPWHHWDVIHNHANIDITFSLNTYSAIVPQLELDHPKIRILVLCAEDHQIDFQTDLELLKQHLPDAELYSPTSLQRQELSTELWRQSWDVLFFAGHSSSDLDEGRFYLSPDLYLTIDDLRYALKRAIANGLQLAIFNSCDGLELARCLADIQLPAAIVMRERIPNEAAQHFLHFFLDSFAHSGRSLHLAVRDARERLHTALDDKYPCASWLPLVYQSPASPTLTWRSLLPPPLPLPDAAPSTHHHQPVPRTRPALRWQTALTTSLIVCGAIWGVRSLGWLEPAELWAYDQMMRHRPQTEQPDPRLLIVGITEPDLEKYGYRDNGERRRVVSDRTLVQAITKLQQHQPRLIGVDIFRDITLGSGEVGQAELLQQLRSSHIINACAMPKTQGNDAGYAAPPHIPNHQLGFANFVPESVIRRHVLGMKPLEELNNQCKVDHAFSTRLAVRYLGYPKAEETPERNIQIGNKILPVIRTSIGNIGGYQSENEKKQLTFGYHFLLNYRATSKIAKQVSLTQLFTEQINPTWIQDKLILIGYDTASDRLATPFSRDNSINQTMPGVIIHAQMISQILSAIEDNRPLLQPWSAPYELLWIGTWSIIGGLLAWRWRSLKLIYISSFTLILLVGSSFILFCYATWVPCIPAGLAVLCSASSRMLHNRFSLHFGNNQEA